MPKQKLEIEIEVPGGYRCVGFGHALPGTLFLSSHSGVNYWDLSDPTTGQYFIAEIERVERVEHWRPATVEDVIRTLQGEKIKARFRDSERCVWLVNRNLCGIVGDEFYKWYDGKDCWCLCEVLDTEDSSQ